MKKLSLFVILLLVSASFTTFFAQVRPPITGNGQKVNQRPSPTPPAKGGNTTAGQTNDDKVNAVEDDEILRIETNLVTIPVKVLDRGGRFIAGLKKDDFKVFEDDAEQEIAYFSNIEEPFTVVLMLDMSYSTVFKTSEIQSAAIGFTAQLRSNDKVMVVSFDQETHFLCEPTTDRQESTRAIKSTQIGTGTSLYEAVDEVIKRLRKIEGRKAIVLFTDGVDTTSQSARFDKNVRDAEELDAIIYPIQYDTYNDVQRTAQMPAPLPIPTGTPSTVPSSTRLPNPTSTQLPFPFPFPQTTVRRNPPSTSPYPNPSPIPTDPTNPNPYPSQNPSVIGAGTTSQEYETANLYLKTMANETGGRVLPAMDKASMALAFSNIADELRQTYSLGFYPKEEKLEKKRRLKVRVAQKGAVVRSRESYTVSKKAKKFALN